MAFTGKATYDAADLPEHVDDVSDLVGLIAPFDTPLLDAIGSPKHAAKSTRHEWDGGQNFTQIFTETVMISGRMDAVGLHAVEREFNYQVIQRLRELMRSLERVVINGGRTEQGGNRNMGGLLNFTEHIADAENAPLTDEILNAAIERATARDYKPNLIVCNGFQKRKIAGFIQASRRYNPESATLRNVVDIYDHGDVAARLILSRWVPADKVLLLRADTIQVMPLQGRSFFVKPLAESGDFRKAQIIGEYTLECTAAPEVVSNLATTNPQAQHGRRRVM